MSLPTSDWGETSSNFINMDSSEPSRSVLNPFGLLRSKVDNIYMHGWIESEPILDLDVGVYSVWPNRRYLFV